MNIYNIGVIYVQAVNMKKQKHAALTVYIGGDMEKDDKELSENPEKGMEQPQNILYLESYAGLSRILSPARLDLLRYLIKVRRKGAEKNVGEIAIELKRRQEAISRDVHYLKNLRMVGLRKDKQAVYVFTEFDSISIQTAPRA